ncbi:39S ribosomal protein L52, mitochondrial [Chelonus insularis]|uniref:39S ribosomal protein L52, mitochondrial n=1 Tax=Chelonus insularis TaxID=460826 RepID=UPI00158E6038|nr:39S ribosomal protein L52, mitochondrial [Chelonus insularis]XP_034940491.1 39S ribosomal protein L52, mitochondrial [Chelonus insularis]
MTLTNKIINGLQYCTNNSFIKAKGFHASASRLLDQDWRRIKGLPSNPNAFGPLTNLPDYSFTDGRPVPFGVKQYLRIQKQRKYFEKITKLVKEIDFAVENHERRTQEAEEKRRKIIENKLKPKGQMILGESNTSQ